MSQKEQTMLELIKSKVREIMPSGIQAYLYGSRARGEAHSDSDWDILILVDAPSANIGHCPRMSLSQLRLTNKLEIRNLHKSFQR